MDLLSFVQQLSLLLSLFNEKSNTTSDSYNSTWEAEDLTEFWDMEMKKDLHIFLSSGSFTSELPVCCDLDIIGTETFHCERKVVKQNMIAISSQNPKVGGNSSQKRFFTSLPECVTRNTLIFDLKSIGIENRTRFLSNGYFGHNKEFYSPQEYCINGITGEFVEVKICEPDCSKERPCIQKCCDPDMFYSFKQKRCIKSNSVLYNPIFYHSMSKKVEEKGLSAHFSVRFPRSFKYHCQENTTQIFPSGNLFAEYLSNSTGRKYFPADFHIRNDGMIMYRKDGKAIVLPDGSPIYLKENSRKCYTLKTEHYCIDGATEYGSQEAFSNDEFESFLVTCSEYLYQPPIVGPLSFVYGNIMIASSFFSLMTVVVYLTLEEKRNIHGLTVVSYATSMFFMYVFLGLAHLLRYYGSDNVLKSRACVIIGIASHLFSLSSFLWLTVMNVDLYLTFRKIRPIMKLNHKIRRNKLWNHYLKYSIFGWGFPILIISLTSYLHFNYEEAVEDDCADFPFSLPAYGTASCEIKQLSLGVYLYFPASALLLCNFLFFVVTTYSLCKHETMTALAVKGIQEQRHHQSYDQKRIMKPINVIQLFFKLFFVMGVTRVFEIVTWYESGPDLIWYWAVFDIFNVLQAIAIFIIYVCKKDVILALKRKLAEILRRPKDNFNFSKRGRRVAEEDSLSSMQS